MVGSLDGNSINKALLTEKKNTGKISSTTKNKDNRRFTVQLKGDIIKDLFKNLNDLANDIDNISTGKASNRASMVFSKVSDCRSNLG